MRKARIAAWTSASAAAVSAAVVALMLYRGTADPVPGETMSLDDLGWMIMIAATACLVVSLMLGAYSLFLRHSLVQSSASPATEGQTLSDGAGPSAGQEATPPARDISALPEDERRIYELIDAAGGEILQKNLVSSGEFSKSKVTRLLDKLEGRELIKRERHGMTNMVRIVK